MSCEKFSKFFKEIFVDYSYYLQASGVVFFGEGCFCRCLYILDVSFYLNVGF